MRFLLMSFVLASTICSPVYATSTGKDSAKQHKITAKSVTYATDPFDLNIERLPANYKGHNILEIYPKISLPRAKGEFEKTAEYEARVERWKKTNILGAITPTDTLAFELSELLAPDTLSLRYNADQEELTATINFEEHRFDSGSARWLETFYQSKNMGNHIGITGMGVKFRVMSHLVTRIGLGIEQIEGRVSLSKRMSRDEATKIKPLVKVFAIVSPIDPYKIGDTTFKNASLSEPDEWLTRYWGLHVNLKAIWLVNGITGEILAKSTEETTPLPDTSTKSPLPLNGEYDKYATQGWSCKKGFKQIDQSCLVQ